MSQQMSQNPEVHYFVVDQRKSRRAYALTPDQIKWLAIWLPLALVIGIQWFDTDIHPLAILPLVMCIGAWKTSKGIVYRNYQAEFEQHQLRKNNNIVYDSSSRKTPLGLSVYNFQSNGATEEIPQVIRDNLTGEQLEKIIASQQNNGFSLGAVYSKRERTDTVYVSGTGLEGSNGDPDEVFAARKGVADALNTAISLYSKKPSICEIYSRRPVNMVPQLLWDRESIDPAVQGAKHLELQDLLADSKGREQLDADGFFAGTVEERQALALKMARAMTATIGEEVTQLTAVSFSRPKFIGVKRGASLDDVLTPRQIRRLPIKRLADALAEELSAAGVTDAKVLGNENVKKVLRTGWDTVDISSWQERVLERANRINETGVEEPMPNPWLDEGMKIVSMTTPTGKPTIQFGNTFIRLKQVSAFEKTNFFAEDLLPMFDAAEFQPASYAGLTLSLCGDILDVASEQRVLTRKRAIVSGYEKHRFKEGLIETEADVEKRNALKMKSDALHFGGIYMMSYNIYVTVLAPTLELLDDYDDLVDAHGRSCGIEFRYIDNEVRHVRTLATALWGVNMVNR